MIRHHPEAFNSILSAQRLSRGSSDIVMATYDHRAVKTWTVKFEPAAEKVHRFSCKSEPQSCLRQLYSAEPECTNIMLQPCITSPSSCVRVSFIIRLTLLQIYLFFLIRALVFGVLL